jgi:hypothetical protein
MYNVDTAIYSNLKHFLVDDTPQPFPSSIIAHKRDVAARWFADSPSLSKHCDSRIANDVTHACLTQAHALQTEWNWK